jgi:hypothetical protein
MEKGGKGMKHLSLAAVGLAIAMSVGAQTTTDEQQQQQPQQGKAKVEENVQPGQKTQSVQPKEREGTRTKVEENTNQPARTRTNVEERVRGDERHSGARVDERGTVSHSTTVFRNGTETQEHLALHRSSRDRSDTHFSIGTHPRDWWLRTYSIVLMDGCHYYLADNGCWYPAYGFDPNCNYPEGVVYCE